MIRRPGCLKRLHMAANACGGESLSIESTDCPHFVTGVAIHPGMRTNQGKTILMLVDVVHRHLPAVDPMAEVALRPVLAPMDVGVAILTLPADIGENAIHVTLLARNVLMESP